jgi:nucleotide-binding universal stress UspA family protein
MREIHRILCPVDLSDVSRHAIDHALVLARWYNATITGLHVCNPVVIPSSDFALVGTGLAPILTDEEMREVRSQVAACFDQAKAAAVDVVVEKGHPAKIILARAMSLPADLIVMGTHGTSGFEHLVLGSVAEKVLRRATCPVLTVPPHTRATSKLPFKRLLCPMDFSDSSLAALEFAFSLAQQGNADVTLLHVFEWPAEGEPLIYRSFNVPEYLRELEHDAHVRLQGLVPDSMRESCNPQTRFSHGKPYREILRIAAEDSSDLIVMGVHGRNPLDLMLFGSTTNQVVRRARCPVLSLRQ